MGNEDEQKNPKFEIEKTPNFILQYSKNYKDCRSKICSLLSQNLYKISETMKKKLKQVKKSFKVYEKLYGSLNLILNTMNNLVKNTKIQKYKLKKQQSMPEYSNSLIKIRNKHCEVSDKDYLRKASKEGREKNFIATNSISIGFLDSIKIVVWNKRKYFYRLVDYVSKIVIMNQVNFSKIRFN
jgi:hypothetical protein